MHQHGTVVAFDHGKGAVGTQDVCECPQRPNRITEMLQDEADEHVIELRGSKGQLEDVRRQKHDVPKTCIAHGGPCPLQRRVGSVDAGEVRGWAATRELDGLCTDAAAGLEHAFAGSVSGVVVKQLGQCCRLVGESAGLALVVAVNVGHLSSSR